MHDAVRPDPGFDRSVVVQRFGPLLFRLALLMTGDARQAVARVEHAYRALPSVLIDPEAVLLRGLLPGRRTRARWQFSASPADAARAGLRHAQAQALLALLARRTPVERLIIGAHLLAGHAPHEIAAQLGEAAPEPGAVLRQFRLEAAGVLGLVPADADPAQMANIDRWLDAALADDDNRAIRRAVLEDGAARALRDGLMAARQTLAQVLAVLFAATPPEELTERLLDMFEQPPHATPQRRHWAPLALGGAVLLLVLAIMFRPVARPQAQTAASQASLSPAETLDAALHRFDRAPLERGVLHERYLVQRADQPSLVFERWYDYGTPQRLRMSVRDADSTTAQFAVSTDGRARVQYRMAEPRTSNVPALDVQVSQQEAQAAMPLLRTLFAPTSIFFSNERYRADVGWLYLAQARARGVTSLGQTMFLGRPALLLSYQTDHLPTTEAPEAAAETWRVVLTVDQETYALLDVTALRAGAAESTALRPWRAEVFEIVDSVTDEQFRLPHTRQVAVRQVLLSARAPWLPSAWFTSFEEAQQTRMEQLLVPANLPSESMRGVVVAPEGRAEDAVLLYESEFQTLVVLSQPRPRNIALGPNAAQRAGDFRYRLVQGYSLSGAGVAAEVYRPGVDNRMLLVLLVDAIATEDEREATVERVIASLTPVTEQNLAIFKRHFAASTAADERN